MVVVGQIIGFEALELWILGFWDFHWIFIGFPLFYSQETKEEAGSREEGRGGEGRGVTGEGRGERREGGQSNHTSV